MPPDEGYLLGNSAEPAGVRLEAISVLFDPSTFRHVKRLGIRPGWRCWEVGAGSPTVPTWLADQVGLRGSVLATDIDLSRLAGPAGSPYDVRRHDVGSDQPPPGPFDLIHARLVLVHVPLRAQALLNLVRVLRPGGWLLVEDADPRLQPLACPDEYGPDQQLANALRHSFRQLLSERGADLGYGRTLPRQLRAAGLTDVGADAYFPMTSSAGDRLEAATVVLLRDRLLAAGIATGAEIERHLANVRAGRLDIATAPMISAWGRCG